MTNVIKPAVAYLRVSTGEQTTDNQRVAIEKWCSKNNYLVVKYYVDQAKSGSIPPIKRDGFRKMVEEIPLMNPKPMATLVYELSRVGRTFYETLQAINTLETLGSPLISVSPKESFLQNLDPSIRKLILAILSWVAEREKEMISQRTKEGMIRAKLEGKHVGRPRKEVRKDLVLKYLRKGLSISAIAKLLEISPKTIRRRLREWGVDVNKTFK